MLCQLFRFPHRAAVRRVRIADGHHRVQTRFEVTQVLQNGAYAPETRLIGFTQREVGMEGLDPDAICRRQQGDTALGVLKGRCERAETGVEMVHDSHGATRQRFVRKTGDRFENIIGVRVTVATCKFVVGTIGPVRFP